MDSDVPVSPVSPRPVSGSRVVITKLRYKLLSYDQPDYQIAGAAGIHHSTLSEYAQGKRAISSKHLISLCELFQCEPEEILGKMEVEIA